MKDAIATVSYRGAVSIPKATIAVQTTCEKVYNHSYYVTTNEQKKYEKNLLPTIIEESELENTDDSPSCSKQLKKQKPRSKEQITNMFYLLNELSVNINMKWHYTRK